ncbi:MAG: rRNA ((2)-)-methyltransferase [Verrucomicrobiales bacterium]|nr:rRNA ((2)-)-methyltransferase [Verrucomicrobiales bacterium]
MKSEASKTSRLRLRVTTAAQTILRSGHPWLFADSIREQNREGKLGELAIIYDKNDSFLAMGLFDPGSPIRVRILHAGKPQNLNDAFWKQKLAVALSRRAGLFDGQTTGYRLINGESDGWPALILDRYDSTLVLKIYSGMWLARLNEIVDLLRAEIPNERIVLRLSRNIQLLAESEFKLREGQILSGNGLAGPVIFLESGIRFEADVLQGQKTGFFLDQRENRRIVETLAQGRNVLNAFSFSGGFSLYAARGGATSVASLDISTHALESAKRNFALNSSNKNIATCRHEIIQDDVFEWLQKPAHNLFGLIIVDPPSLAKRESERADAIRAYGKLCGSAMERLSPGGILVAASCSAHVSADEFFNVVRSAAPGGRRFEELMTTRHAPDHHASFKEAEYLKCIYLKSA